MAHRFSVTTGATVLVQREMENWRRVVSYLKQWDLVGDCRAVFRFWRACSSLRSRSAKISRWRPAACFQKRLFRFRKIVSATGKTPSDGCSASPTDPKQLCLRPDAREESQPSAQRSSAASRSLSCIALDPLTTVVALYLNRHRQKPGGQDLDLQPDLFILESPGSR